MVSVKNPHRLTSTQILVKRVAHSVLHWSSPPPPPSPGSFPCTSKFSKVILPFIVSISDVYYICDQLLHLPSIGLGQT